MKENVGLVVLEHLGNKFYVHVLNVDLLQIVISTGVNRVT
jgi:hypothetical protein